MMIKDCEQCGRRRNCKRRFCSQECYWNSKKGRSLPDEHKKKISDSMRRSEKFHESMQSQEFKEKMRVLHLGYKNPSKRLEVRKRMSDRKNEFYKNGGEPWNKGKPFYAVRGLKNGIFVKPDSYKKGSFYSKKNNKTIHYRSSYELIELETIENDVSVVHYEYEPFAVEYRNRKGGMRHVVPDFLLHYKDGTIELREIKAQWRIDKDEGETLAKLKACKDYAISRGWGFNVLTEKDLFKL